MEYFISYRFESLAARVYDSLKTMLYYFRWSDHSQMTPRPQSSNISRNKSAKFSPRENVRPSSDEKKGRLINAPPDQGQPRASIPLPILRRAIGGPSMVPTSSNSYAVYFVHLFPPAASPFAHLPPTFPGCLTWSVASSCTRATRTFSERRPTI